VCDDCLPGVATLKSRQDARRLGLELEQRGEARRLPGVCALCGRSKTVTTVQRREPEAAGDHSAIGNSGDQGETDAPEERPPGPRVWHWEGRVQTTLVAWLAQEGFGIERVADTATREAGKDIVARTPAGKPLWISVKGFPEGKNAYTQARHWFSSAVFDLILYRDENAEVDLALAFPDGFPTYRALAARLGPLRQAIPFTIYWVAESGTIRPE